MHLTKDGKRLTQHAADFWIRRMRSDFEDSDEQKGRRDQDRSWGSSARQVEQRQGGRYNAYMIKTFGGQDCLKHFFLTGSWEGRMLPKRLDMEASSEGTRRPPHQKIPKPNARKEQNRKSAILYECDQRY